MEGRAQTHASVLGMEETRKKRTAATFLCCRLITVGSWLEPTVIELNHCRFLAWTGSDKWPLKHCQWCGPSLSVLAQPQLFFHFQAHNRQWRYITAGSHKSGSDDAGNDVQIWRSVWWFTYTVPLTPFHVEWHLWIPKTEWHSPAYHQNVVQDGSKPSSLREPSLELAYARSMWSHHKTTEHRPWCTTRNVSSFDIWYWS